MIYSKMLVILSLLLACIYSCSGKTTTSNDKGIIGDDTSEILTDKPPYAEYLTKRDGEKILANCNGVRTSDGKFYTAGHCLPLYGAAKTISLSDKGIATSFKRYENVDLAIGEVAGGSAPSNSIRVKAESLQGEVRVAAVWFNIEDGTWRLSRGKGQVSGIILEHDLDLNPGASGAGIFVESESGQRELIAIHLGYVRERNRNVGLMISEENRITDSFVWKISYQDETRICAATQSKETQKWEWVCSDGSEGSEPGGTGDEPGTGDNPGPGDSANPGSPGNEGGENGSGHGHDDDGGDDNDSSGLAGGGVVIWGAGSNPAGGSSAGSGPSGSKRGDYCFECDLTSMELGNQSRFGKIDCEVSPIEPLLGAVPDEISKGPGFSINFQNPGKFTDSLREIAAKLIAETHWKPSEQAKNLSEEAQKKLKQWLDLVIRDLDDYYALIIDKIASKDLKEPDLADIDISAESIEKARAYLDAVKDQVLNNPDQYLAARKEVIRAADTAFGVAEEALKNGDQETAETATQIGLLFADAAIGWIPVAGWVKDALEAGTGHNLLTGEELDDFEKTMAWVGVFSAGVGSKLLTAGKVAVLTTVVTKTAFGGKAVAVVGNVINKAKEINRAAKEAGIRSNVAGRLRKLKDSIKFRKPLATAEEIEKDVAVSIERYKDLPLIRGQKPINGLLAGETYFPDLSEAMKLKYPGGVKIKTNGMPEFGPYAKDLKDGKKFVIIDATTSSEGDFAAANKIMGWAETPENWTWHHHEDLGHMQLVPTDIHDVVKHHGGVSIWGWKSRL